MSNKPNSMAPFCPTTFAVRSSLGPGLMARDANGTYADLNFYTANVNEGLYGGPGDVLYVPAFQLVERVEPGAPVEPVVGFTWTHNGVTRVILEAQDGGRVCYASNLGGKKFGVYTDNLSALAAGDGYPTKPGRKIREWQPINRVSGP